MLFLLLGYAAFAGEGWCSLVVLIMAGVVWSPWPCAGSSGWSEPPIADLGSSCLPKVFHSTSWYLLTITAADATPVGHGSLKVQDPAGSCKTRAVKPNKKGFPEIGNPFGRPMQGPKPSARSRLMTLTLICLSQASVMQTKDSLVYKVHRERSGRGNVSNS